MPELKNVLILLGDGLIYFIVLAALFRFRNRLGIGAFFCALGVMHFLETYLASIFYVSIPLGVVASPGSSILFTGKLLMLLLVYIREDAAVVRQPIYGLLFGNLLVVGLSFALRLHDIIPLEPQRLADFHFLDEMGALMTWGTVVLFADSILIVLLYERLRAWVPQSIFARLLISLCAVLTFDQAVFYAGLYVLTGAPLTVLGGGWIAKMAASIFYAALGAIYLVSIERRGSTRIGGLRVSDVFDILTYRERYEDLLARTGRDAITGVLDRGRLEHQGRRMVRDAALCGRPVSLMLIDIDNFKTFNDRHGHAAGDSVLKRIAAEITANVRATDPVFRFGGEEFVVICDGLQSGSALTLAERIRREIAGNVEYDGGQVTVSIGVATCADDASDYDGLFAVADARLYRAKAAGRNCVIGERDTSPAEIQPRLVIAD